MIPIVTPAEMGAIDRAAPEPVEVLIGRAGAATARAALRMLGGGYGRRVAVLAGPGNNGHDGRDAARRLARRGVRVVVHELGDLPARIDGVDLVVDAALGTGARPGFDAPQVAAGIPVLAVDLPSGVDGLTGEAGDGVLAADRTVTFAALKPGLLLGRGRELAGAVEVADIGLDTTAARAHLVTDADVARLVPSRPTDAHKWHAAVWVVAGSPGMTGAAHLTARAAQRAGAGYVRLSTPGLDDDPGRPTEAVGTPLPSDGWADAVLADAERFRALALGPGLGRASDTADEVRRLLGALETPVVVDGDGLHALGDDPAAVLADRPGPTVLTPHDGEAQRLLGHPVPADRLDAGRGLAARTGSVVLLKGPTTVVAGPDGRALVVTAGDARLATAGTGDVLTGVVAALLAVGTDPLGAAAAGAHLHGRAGVLGFPRGLVAGDLPDLLPHAFPQT
ncbi:NAD(P)H-hydrate dehydratase [Actinomarinicola tropica]|uniref:ADP-dependent (S)-NAD(P)H-hydrate dehydratase n=1 Tax=Actinomarinicola tropica TaxID=2789776 RepID=A0A5Q2RAK0_9ACTN|nr:NAD(P)H-hydrate dehydratase [Actinomarinicola tropica]QGG93899.1 NAD(P)H-hydrate dehydratase [Actinomarinicola tropica]